MSYFNVRSVRAFLFILVGYLWLGYHTPHSVYAQDLTNTQQREIITGLAQRLAEGYVYEDKGLAMGQLVQEQLAGGAYAASTHPDSFAVVLTEVLQGYSNDRHLRIRHRPPQPAVAQPVQAPRPRHPRTINYGFPRVELLDQTVGYLNLRLFMSGGTAIERAAAAMTLLSEVDALIIDLRENGGGGQDMLQFLTTYLFDKPTHLLNNFARGMEVPEEVWTLDQVPGKRLTDIPVYLLTSPTTFSAAEAFTFGLKLNNRVTIVGERTGGGGHYGGWLALDHNFAVWLPRGRAYNPATGLGWEAEGIEPDHAFPHEQALDVALALAKEAGARHAEERATKQRTLRDQMATQLTEAAEGFAQNRYDDAMAMVHQVLGGALDAFVVDEVYINQRGYHYISQENLDMALAFFLFNAQQFPNAFNAFDSLGEAYMLRGENDLAITNYRKSLQLNPLNTNAEQMLERLGAPVEP